MSDSPQNPYWGASNVVDGRINQTIPYCAIMDFLKNYQSVWLKVRLGRRSNIAYLEVYFRESTVARATGFYFYSFDVSEVFDPNSLNQNNLIYHHDPLSGCPPSIQNITVNRLSIEVVFVNRRPADYTSNCFGDDLRRTNVEICEVKVMGCDVNRYSSNNCGSICPAKCKQQFCDVFNGSCIYGCTNPNALTLQCLDCADGQFVSNGQCVQCPGHCNGGLPCNKSTGRCDTGCQEHWTSEFCNEMVRDVLGRYVAIPELRTTYDDASCSVVHDHSYQLFETSSILDDCESSLSTNEHDDDASSSDESEFEDGEDITNTTEHQTQAVRGRHIVELEVLANALDNGCSNCKQVLHLSSYTGENRYGLGSVLHIKCLNCQRVNYVPTGKRQNNNKWDVNSKLGAAMIFCGIGESIVNNLLASLNLPSISPTTLKKKRKRG